MNQLNLLGYLKEYGNIEKSKFYFLKYELEKHLFLYGKQFHETKETELSYRQFVNSQIKFLFINMIKGYSSLKNKPKPSNKNILSGAFFSLYKEIEKKNFYILQSIDTYRPSSTYAGNIEIIINYYKINQILKSINFSDLLSAGFFNKIDLFANQLSDLYRTLQISSLIIPNDVGFLERINLAIFKELKKPSFVFLHGLPGLYHKPDTDYLMVWGDKIKDNYIKFGCDPDRILVTGHPSYKKMNNNILRNNKDNILIISKVMRFETDNYETKLFDRGNSILYLYSIENTLKKIGIKQVRLRIHPSENIYWYFQFISKEFFKLDKLPINESLSNSTLVIGPTSTMLLESIYFGVNYVVYEPGVNNMDLGGIHLKPPFDGSDIKVQVAKNEETLLQMLKENIIIDGRIFNDYISTPFNIDSFTSILSQ